MRLIGQSIRMTDPHRHALIAATGQPVCIAHVDKSHGPFKCLDPACGHELIAHKGAANQHYFAHKPDSKCVLGATGSREGGGGESSQHLFCKFFVARYPHLPVFFRPCVACSEICIGVTLRQDGVEAVTEFPIGKYIVDVAILDAVTKKPVAVVEIFHTHAIDRDKFNALAAVVGQANVHEVRTSELIPLIEQLSPDDYVKAGTSIHCTETITSPIESCPKCQDLLIRSADGKEIMKESSAIEDGVHVSGRRKAAHGGKSKAAVSELAGRKRKYIPASMPNRKAVVASKPKRARRECRRCFECSRKCATLRLITSEAGQYEACNACSKECGLCHTAYHVNARWVCLGCEIDRIRPFHAKTLAAEITIEELKTMLLDPIAVFDAASRSNIQWRIDLMLEYGADEKAPAAVRPADGDGDEVDTKTELEGKSQPSKHPNPSPLQMPPSRPQPPSSSSCSQQPRTMSPLSLPDVSPSAVSLLKR